MQEEFKNYLKEEGKEEISRICNLLFSRRHTAIYINKTKLNGFKFYMELEHLLNYCCENNYKNIVFYCDDVYEHYNEGYEELLTDISYGEIETLIIYSIDDITNDKNHYELLSKASINNCKIKILYLDIDKEYSDEELDLLKYIANIEK